MQTPPRRGGAADGEVFDEAAWLGSSLNTLPRRRSQPPTRQCRRPEAAQARLQTEKADLEPEIERLRALREGQSAATDRVWLNLYDILRERRDGSAVATVERSMCQGCRITLPRNIIQRARNPEELVQCVSCERILVFV